MPFPVTSFPQGLWGWAGLRRKPHLRSSPLSKAPAGLCPSFLLAQAAHLRAPCAVHTCLLPAQPPVLCPLAPRAPARLQLPGLLVTPGWNPSHKLCISHTQPGARRAADQLTNLCVPLPAPYLGVWRLLPSQCLIPRAQAVPGLGARSIGMQFCQGPCSASMVHPTPIYVRAHGSPWP